MKIRLDLLQQANVISPRAHQGCLAAVAILDHHLDISHDNEQYQMAITHLARAIDRIWQHEAIKEGLDRDLFDEIEADECYPMVLKLHKKVLQALAMDELPASEESFMIANIYALIQLSLEEA